MTLLTLLLPVLVIIGVWVFFIWMMKKKQTNQGPSVNPVCCQTCGTKAPATRQAYDFEEYLWGGWTCKTCLTTVDRLGVARPGVNGRPASQPLSPFGQALMKHSFTLGGGIWGLLMWIVMVLIPTVTAGLRTGDFEIGRLVFGFALCATGGAVFGGLMFLVMSPLRAKKHKDPADHF